MPGIDNHPPKPRFSGLVIIMLIILAALVWKYYDLRSEIHLVRLESMASSLKAASTQNYAAHLLNSEDALSVEDCRDAAGLLRGITGYDSGEHPFTKEHEGYRISDLDNGQCRVVDAHGNSARFQVHIVE